MTLLPDIKKNPTNPSKKTKKTKTSNKNRQDFPQFWKYFYISALLKEHFCQNF